MEFCGNCGAQVPEGASVCPGCGAGIGQAAAPAYEAEVVVDEAKDAEDNKLMGILAYIPFLFLIPVFTGDVKKSPFLKFHANQGMITTALLVAYSVASSVVSFVIRLIFQYGALYRIFSTIFGLVYLAIVILIILGIINAVKGARKELPLIGGFDLLKMIVK